MKLLRYHRGDFMAFGSGIVLLAVVIALSMFGL
jgi:hypothetical protein